MPLLRNYLLHQDMSWNKSIQMFICVLEGHRGAHIQPHLACIKSRICRSTYNQGSYQQIRDFGRISTLGNVILKMTFMSGYYLFFKYLAIVLHLSTYTFFLFNVHVYSAKYAESQVQVQTQIRIFGYSTLPSGPTSSIYTINRRPLRTFENDTYHRPFV